MPCKCDYLEANDLERECDRLTMLLDEVKTGKKVSPEAYIRAGYNPEFYNKGVLVLKPIADRMTAELCDILGTCYDVYRSSLELQAWWRDHQKKDSPLES